MHIENVANKLLLKITRFPLSLCKIKKKKKKKKKIYMYTQNFQLNHYFGMKLSVGDKFSPYCDDSNDLKNGTM